MTDNHEVHYWLIPNNIDNMTTFYFHVNFYSRLLKHITVPLFEFE